MKLLRVADILDERGILSKDFAKKVGISNTSLTSIKKGNSFPKKEILEKMARILNIEVLELFYQIKKKDQLSNNQKMDLILKLTHELIDDKFLEFYSLNEDFNGEMHQSWNGKITQCYVLEKEGNSIVFFNEMNKVNMGIYDNELNEICYLKNITKEIYSQIIG